MCGRYTLTTPGGRALAERFVLADPDALEPETLHRFNVCPTEPIAIVAGEDGSRRVRTVRWGLVPPWARALGKGFEPINARSETVATKAPFAELFARPERRCLVLADGWYEWLRSENPKQPRIPFRYTVDDGDLFAFAGLFGYAKIGEEWVTSATILTTTANEICAPVHDRMPVVLPPDAESTWIDPDAEEGELLELLRPAPEDALRMREVGDDVNDVRKDGPALLEPPMKLF